MCEAALERAFSSGADRLCSNSSGGDIQLDVGCVLGRHVGGVVVKKGGGWWSTDCCESWARKNWEISLEKQVRLVWVLAR